jgi:hypothetical protein
MKNYSNRTLLVSLLFSALLFGVFPVQSLAQAITGSISGTVKDSSGAVVPSASVRASNVATGAAFHTSSNSLGIYTFPYLPPGTYTISAQHSGFSKTTLSGIKLDVYQQAVIDIEMKVGGVQQTVTVQGSTPLVDTSSSSIGTEVGNQAIENLPLNLREVSALALIVPGTVATTGRSLTSSTGNGSGFNDSSFAGAGGYSGGNLLLIDGMISRTLNNGAFALNPPPEMVQEFKIQNDVYDAAFGLTSGTVMNLITQSGTNKLHGHAYDFVRNRDFDARNYFDTAAVSPTVPEYTRNQFGSDAGFPILKNKVFLFGGYEGLRLAQGSNISSLVPSAAQKSGDFSSLLTGTMQNLCGPGGPSNLNYDTGQIFDPKTESNYTCPNGNVILVGTPIPNNNIAKYLGGSGNIDPFAQKVLALFPNPNDGIFFLNEEPHRDNRNQYDGRLDWNISKSDLLFGRYLLGAADQLFPNAIPFFAGTQHFRGHNVVGGWTHTFGPNLVNDARIGYQQDYLKYTCQGCPRAAGTLANFGIVGLSASNPEFEEYPNVSFVNFPSWGDGFPGYYPDILPDSLYEYEDTVTKLWGRHTLTFGADLNFWNTKGVSDPIQANGVVNFSGQYSDLAGESSAATAAADAADLELGYPSGGLYTKNAFVTNLVGGNWIGVFVQDNYRVNANLTVEAGFRWDYRRQPVEEHNNLAAFYPLSKSFQSGDALLISALPDSANNALCSEPYLQSATTGQCVVATSTERAKLGFNGNQVKQVSFGPKHGNFSPRLAFSVRPTGSDRLVVHVGAGVFLDLPLTNQLGATDDNNPITTQSPTYVTSVGAPPPLTNGAPTTTQQMFVGSLTPNINQIYGQLMPSPFYHTPTVFEWSMSIQTQVTANMALETAYLGNRGIHEDFLHMTGNQPIPGVTSLQQRRPWPDFNQLRFDTYDAYSNYNALTVKVTKRSSRGLFGLLAYTYSKAMDDNSGTSETEAAPQDDNNPKAEYAVADTNLTQRLSLSGTYQLPFGKGRQFLGNRGTLADELIGGWDLSAIVTAQSGIPFTVGSAEDFSNTGSGDPRPDRTCSGVGQKSITNWFNQACFPTTALQAALASGTPRFGNSGRNVLTGPGLVDVDTSLIKHFSIHENTGVDFRSDFFNLLNHPNFALPNSTIGSGTSGIISNTVPIGTAGYNREIQLSLEMNF